MPSNNKHFTLYYTDDQGNLIKECIELMLKICYSPKAKYITLTRGIEALKKILNSIKGKFSPLTPEIDKLFKAHVKSGKRRLIVSRERTRALINRFIRESIRCQNS